jgi:protocatechuate 3,4-dioxygenase beta subunit
MSVIQTYSNLVAGSYTFQNLSVTETDVGTVSSFVADAGIGYDADIVPNGFSPYTGVEFGGFSSAALAPGSTTTLVFNYDVSNTNAALGINALQQGFTVDKAIGSGISLTAVMKVFDSAGHMVGQQSIDLNSPINPTVGGAPVLLAAAYQSLHVQITVVASVAPNAIAASSVGFSYIEQGFNTTALANQANLGDRVFLDANGNGVQDAGELGIGGVVVNLLDANGTPTGLTTTTDASGNYSFANINAGTYTVQFVAPSGEVFTKTGQGTIATDSNAGANGLTGTISLAAGQTDNTIDAGLYVPVSINTFVFGDNNADGISDGADVGLANIAVTLQNGSNVTVVTVATGVTDATGHISFTGLPPGTYQIVVAQPTGSLQTVASNVAAPITLASGQSFNAVAGYNGGNATHQTVPASLTGHVFVDLNGDGVQVAGDTNLSGVLVQLLDGSGNPIVGSTATTDANGFYSFANLTPGSYAVAVVAPAGYSFSQVGTNANAAVDSIVSTIGRTTPVTLAAGQAVANQNAAIFQPATITATIYTDLNADGSKGASETGLAGVTVALLDVNGNPTGLTAVTNASGGVTFTGLKPGTYSIAPVLPAGSIVSQTPTPVVVPSGGTGAIIEGIYAPASLSGHVFLDQNADGVQAAGDVNQAGITVQLLDSTGTPIAGKTAITDGNGAYSFTGLKPGSYAVQVTAPTGDAFSSIGTNANAALDSIVGATGKTTAVTLVSGAIVPNQNAAFYVPATVTATIYTDVNADGSKGASEIGLAGVTVALLDVNGNPTGLTAVTNASGGVTFTGLKPGTYSIAPVLPAGSIVSQTPIPVVVPSGGTGAIIEGLYAPASLSGHVFLDQNADGVQAASDINQAGITVQLLDSTGAPIAGKTAITDANGAYSFTGLKPGSYAVQVTAPTGNTFSGIGTNANAALDSIVGTTGKTTAVTLVSGANVPNQNAAFYAPATVTAVIYTDLNADGSKGASETGLAGVTVALLDANGNPTGLTAVTNASGGVTFTGIKPGTYSIAPVLPAGSIVSQTPTPVVVPSGGTGAIIEGIYAPASLSGHVFLDQNGDGVQAAGDINQAGITVRLLDSTGTPIAGKTAITDANGAYSFTGLKPGSYAVQVTAPTGDAFSSIGTNANAALDSIVGTTGKTTAVTLVSGATVPNQNAAYYVPATVTALVYGDANGNGIKGTGETGVAGVTVKLLDASGNPTGLTAITNASGIATFTGLKPGTYSIAPVLAAGTVVTQAPVPVTVLSGGTGAAVEGYKLGASLSGHVFVDQNADGVQIAADTNLSGQKVQLLDANGNVIVGATTTTDANGYYIFTGLAAGTYSVAVTGQSGYAFSAIGTNANAAVDSVVDSTGHKSVTLAAGQAVTNINAGEYKVTAALVVDKSVSSMVVQPTGCWNGSSFFAQDTYTFRVTNTGTQALTNVQVLDNHGSAAIPDYITPTAVTNGAGKNVGDANGNGLLDVGESWSYSATLIETGYAPVNVSTVAAQSFNNISTSAGSTIWLNASIKNYSTANGTSYAFKGLTATITVAGTATPYVYHLPDSYVSFSSTVSAATTHFDSVQNAWITVAPAGKALGNVFMTGEPIKVPAGVDFKNASVSVSMAQAVSTTGAAAPQWQWGASNFNSFSYTNGAGQADYNEIGVKPTDGACSGFATSNACGTPEQVIANCGSAGNVTTAGTCSAQSLPTSSLNCWTSAASCGNTSYGAFAPSATTSVYNRWSGWSNVAVTTASQRTLGTGTWCLSDSSSGLNVSVSANGGSAAVNQVACANNASISGIGISNQSCNGIVAGQYVTVDCGDMHAKGLAVSSLCLNGLASGQTGYVWGTNDDGATYKLIGSCTGTNNVSQGSVSGCEGYAKLAVNCSGGGSNSNLTIGQLGVCAAPNYCGTQSASANVNLSFVTDSSALDTVTATASTLATTTTTTNNCVTTVSSSGNGNCSVGWVYGNSGCYFGGDDDRDWRHQSYQVGSNDYYNYYCSGYSSNSYGPSCNYNYCGTQTTTTTSGTTTTTTPGTVVTAFDTADVEVLTGSSSIYVASVGAISNTVTIGSGRDVLSLFVTEDYYLGDAQFTISVDGTQIGGTQTATALRGSGLVQQFKVLGNFSGTAHNVAINFLNDVYAGTATTDRNLYVAQAALDGTSVSNAALSLMGNGVQTLAVQSLDVLSLSISEDAYLGNAQFTISVDGCQVGGVQSTAALHSLGASQQFNLTGKFAAGTHTVAVNFLNDSYAGTAATDRNLYVNGATINGTTIGNSGLALGSNGTQTFTFQGAGAANGTSLTLNAADYTPTGSLSVLYGVANKLEFIYTPSDIVSGSVLSASLGSEAGTNTGGMAFIEISNSADAYAPGSQVFYMGNLAPGAKLFADASVNLNNVANPTATAFFGGGNSTIYAHVFANENDFVNHAASAQELTYNPGAGGLQIGDQIGSLKLAGYVGTNGQGYLVA